MEPTQETSGNGRKLSKSTLVIALIVIALLGAAAYVLMSSGKLSALPEADVLASVGGVDITEADVTTRMAQTQSSREQALEELINKALVLADAEAQGITVTDEEVAAQYDSVRSRFETEEAFSAELEKNGFTVESFRQSVREDLIINKYVAAVAERNPVAVSEEEVSSFYTELEAQSQGQDIPTLETLRGDIETELKNRKLGAIIQQVIDSLRAAAGISVSGEASTEAPPAQ